jgi:hypothetical protein
MKYDVVLSNRIRTAAQRARGALVLRMTASTIG